MPPSPKPAAKPAAASTTAAKAAPAKTAPDRLAMVAEAAYFIAQKRGFGAGKEAQDWTEAEKQVDTLLKKSK